MWLSSLILLAALVSPTQETQDEAIELAKKAVEAEEGSGMASLRVRQAEPVQWPDTSLGCAEEGMMYAQVITHGYRVLIQAGARLYRVHVGKGRAVICGKPIDRSTKKIPKKASSEDEAGIQGEVPDDVLTAIIDDFVEKKDAERSSVEVSRAVSLTWNDGSLGCPQPGAFYTQAPVEGYQVILKYEGKTYDYRATRKGYFFICEKSVMRPKRPVKLIL